MTDPNASISPMSQPRGRGDRPRVIEPELRVRSDDYGDGTVVAVLFNGIQIEWDRPLEETIGTRVTVHDRSYVERLEWL